MKRSDAVRQLNKELGFDSTSDDQDCDELPASDEVADVTGYSNDMLTEQCRLYGLIDEDEAVVDDDDEEEPKA